jgi:CRISPR/Cas system Type II protein with McrA/HNH and RuvC-like nuclease domain
MAKDEMNMMKELDVETLSLHQEKLYFYYAQRDDWVGAEREVVLGSLPDVTANTFHGPADIPHAFCISKSYFTCRVLPFD